jgi:hypothetical protein
MDYGVSVEQEVGEASMRRPHVVVLGAGASRQACLAGDKNGRVLPLMSDLVGVLDLRTTLEDWGVDPNQNFEAIFSDLYKNGETSKIEQIEKRVEDYLGGLELSDSPNLYDHLVLSLRGTDLIATFNWDPLLIQAYRRNSSAGLRLPRLAFLHGNVAVGYCPLHAVAGVANGKCRTCGTTYQPTPLLYPIEKKDYSKDGFIANEWNQLKNGFGSAFMITIFGYSGPRTDKEALDAMKQAWGKSDNRAMEQTAFISIQSDDEVRAAWEPFIHTHHYELTADFYDSWIAKHPRRTGEAYVNQYLEAKFVDENPIPTALGFPRLHEWYQQFKPAEDRSSST